MKEGKKKKKKKKTHILKMRDFVLYRVNADLKITRGFVTFWVDPILVQLCCTHCVGKHISSVFVRQK